MGIQSTTNTFTNMPSKTERRGICLLLFFGLLSSVTCDGTCQEGWEKLKSKCYKIFPHAPANRAQELCKAEQATLVSIPSQEVNDFILLVLAPLLNVKEPAGGLTIGLVQEPDEGEWKWTNGEPFSYEHWYAYDDGGEEPNNYQGMEDCAEFVVYVGDRNLKKGFWNDISCSKRNPFICSMDVTKDTETTATETTTTETTSTETTTTEVTITEVTTTETKTTETPTTKTTATETIPTETTKTEATTPKTTTTKATTPKTTTTKTVTEP